MKKMVTLLCAIFIALPVWAQSYDEAESLWEGRGGNVTKALEASDMYKALSNAEGAGSYEQAEALLLQTETLFFYADTSSNIDVKKKYHKIGENIALRAGGMFKNLGDDENLALSYFWAGAHLGKWGLANGILASLFKVKTMMRHIDVIKNAGGQELMSFGYNRLLGRLLFKLPWPKGDKKEALRLAKEGFEKTMNEDFGVSEHGLNNIYYAEYLIQSGNKVEAKRILKLFVDITNYEDFNSERMPETEIEQAVARKILNNL